MHLSGVYFSVKGPASYDLGSTRYEDDIIADFFGPSYVKEYRGKHMVDFVIVYGISPCVLTQVCHFRACVNIL